MAQSTFTQMHQLDQMFGPSSSHLDDYHVERVYTSTQQSPAEGLLFLLQAAQELEEQPSGVPAKNASNADQNNASLPASKQAVVEQEAETEPMQPAAPSPGAVHHRVPQDIATQPSQSALNQHMHEQNAYHSDIHAMYHHGGQDAHGLSMAPQLPPQYSHHAMSGGMQQYAGHQPPHNGMYTTHMHPQAQSYMHAQAHAHAHAQAHAQAQAQAQAQAHMSGGYVAGPQQYHPMHQGHMVHPGQQPSYVAVAQQHAMMMQHQAAQAHAAGYGAGHPHGYP